MEMSLRPFGEDDSSDESYRSLDWRARCFVIYMYVRGSDDSSTDTAAEGSSTVTASESEAFH